MKKKKCNEVRAWVEEVTPSVAEKWMARNTRNRKLKPRTVGKLAAELREGRWRLTPDAIAFDVDGTLINGQHRLAAIATAGVAGSCLVAHGLEPDAFIVTDDGVKRKFSDVLEIDGVANSKAVSTVVMRELLWRKRDGFRDSSAYYTAEAASHSRIELDALFKSDPDGFLRAARVARQVYDAIGLATRAYGPCYYRFAQVSLFDADGFTSTLITGEHDGRPMPKTYPPIALRDMVLRDTALPAQRRRLTSPHYVSALIVKAWNAYRHGVPVHTLRFSAGGARPETFPAIDGYDKSAEL